MTLPPAPPLDRTAVARAAAAAVDGTTTWADAFTALGLRPPPAATTAVALPPAAPRATLLASFSALAAAAAAESASRSATALPEPLFEAAWVAGGGSATTEAGGPALAAAAARAGLDLDLPPRLKRARAPSDLTRAAAAGGGVPYAAFRAALLADGS